jgi:hypothetical protein
MEQLMYFMSVFLSTYTSGHNIAESNQVIAMPSSLPSPPSLSVTVSSSGNDIENKVILNWTASSCFYPVTAYKIYQDDVLIQTLSSELTFAVEHLTYGQSYNFSVSAISQVGEGSKLNSISATPISVPTSPTNLLVSYDDHNQNHVDLQWSASVSNGSDITSYTIQYSLDPTFQSGVYSVPAYSTNDTLVDSQLIIPYADKSTTTGWFYFQVCANNNVGSSPFSNTSTISVEELPVAVQELSASNDQNQQCN